MHIFRLRAAHLSAKWGLYVSWIGIVLLTMGAPAITAARAADTPNFVIFVADDMSWDDCGAYGHPHILTPNIDLLAQQGIRMDRAYLTCSSCSPSRCSILTGRYPHSTGAGELHLPLPASQDLVTRPLREMGYWTAAVGKWHLGEQVADQVDYRQGAAPENMGQAWVEALKARPHDKSFFLWAAHSDPHRPYQAGTIDPPHTREDVIVPQYLPDTPLVREDLALYYDEISRFDEHIGMVLKELEQQGLSENTLVIVLSDNGRPFPYCKTRVHVPGVRTPLIARWPAKIPSQSTTDSVISSVDLAPTLLELAGAKLPATLQGKSFSQLLTNPGTVIREYAYAEHNWHDYRAFERAVYSQRYCYIRNWLPNTPGTPPADAVRSPTFEVMQQLAHQGELSQLQLDCFVIPRPEEFLFDVNADPDCVDNLAADPGLNHILQDMRNALKEWQAATDDSFPGEAELTPDGFDRQTGERLINAAHPRFAK